MFSVAFYSVVFFQQISAISAFDLLRHISFVPTLIHSIPLLIVLCRRRIEVNQSLPPLLPFSPQTSRPVAVALPETHHISDSSLLLSLAALHLSISSLFDTVWFDTGQTERRGVRRECVTKCLRAARRQMSDMHRCLHTLRLFLNRSCVLLLYSVMWVSLLRYLHLQENWKEWLLYLFPHGVADKILQVVHEKWLRLSSNQNVVWKCKASSSVAKPINTVYQCSVKCTVFIYHFPVG